VSSSNGAKIVIRYMGFSARFQKSIKAQAMAALGAQHNTVIGLTLTMLYLTGEVQAFYMLLAVLGMQVWIRIFTSTRMSWRVCGSLKVW
jgi:isoprenylcysteine carboxyl methyltransferase (ICMT) family protein YpbQ